MARNAKIIIFDEPTAVLTPQETQEFFAQLELLKKQEYTIIIITHKLKEIKQICDRITIMKNGRFIGMFDVNALSEAEISRLMVGRDIVQEVNKPSRKRGDIVLAVNHLSKITSGGKMLLNDVSFTCRQGEIVCLCGVEGNGQRELVDIITGFDQDYSGQVMINHQNINKKTIKQIRDMGESHIPEDRTLYGVDLASSIADNLISIALTDVSNGIFINKKRVEEVSEEGIKNYQIKCENAAQKVEMLSGGNMQKVVVARETRKTPSLLVANQPTRGVDIGAIEFIHKKIMDLSCDKTAVLLVSSDLTEVFRLADKIIVFYAGKIVAKITNVSEITEEELGLYMLGLKSMDEVQDV